MTRLFISQVRSQRGNALHTQCGILGLQPLHALRVGIHDVNDVFQRRLVREGLRRQVGLLRQQPEGTHATTGRQKRKQQTNDEYCPALAQYRILACIGRATRTTVRSNGMTIPFYVFPANSNSASWFWISSVRSGVTDVTATRYSRSLRGQYSTNTLTLLIVVLRVLQSHDAAADHQQRQHIPHVRLTVILVQLFKVVQDHVVGCPVHLVRVEIGHLGFPPPQRRVRRPLPGPLRVVLANDLRSLRDQSRIEHVPRLQDHVRFTTLPSESLYFKVEHAFVHLPLRGGG